MENHSIFGKLDKFKTLSHEKHTILCSSFALCGITSFSVRPLRWAIALAAFFALLAIAEIIYVIYVACFDGQTVSGWASLAILISVLGAAILLMLGIMGEYLGKLFMQCKQRPEYIIKDKE